MLAGTLYQGIGILQLPLLQLPCHCAQAGKADMAKATDSNTLLLPLLPAGLQHQLQVMLQQPMTVMYIHGYRRMLTSKQPNFCNIARQYMRIPDSIP